MKRILFIAPAALPVNGAESIVNFKLLQLLAKNGYIIDLVTKKYKNTTYPDANITIENVNVKSVEVDNRINLKTFLQHLLTLLVFGVCYKGSHWAYCALPVCKKLLQENDYDYIFTKNHPSELLGAFLRRKYGIKWFATWNDPFPQHKYPAPYAEGPKSKKWFTTKLLRRMSEADIHIFPNIRLRNYMLQYLNVSLEKTRVIAHICQTTETEMKEYGEQLKLIHSGNLGTMRDPSKFLTAFAKFIQKNPAAKINLTFVGQTGDAPQKLAKQLGIDQFLTFLPPVDYFENLNLLKNFDVSVIIEANMQEGIFLPTKVGDAMQLRKKIFAVSPNKGVLHDLYENKNIDYCANVADEQSILEELERCYNDFLTKNKKEICEIPVEYNDNYILNQYTSL